MRWFCSDKVASNESLSHATDISTWNQEELKYQNSTYEKRAQVKSWTWKLYTKSGEINRTRLAEITNAIKKAFGKI